ncbi:hypothetical protein F4604DRAFT_1683514 [Suillus subluteus]|nr:hypothetical protein F4604DRAFT_1683514 [Suillus subluteus]
MSHSELSAAANKAFSDAADKVEHLLVWAQQLQPADQQHLDITMEMGQALTAVCTKYSEGVTVLSPLILSATAELTEHLDDNGTGLISSPVWSNIWVDDPRIKGHPLFTSTLQYQQPVLPPSPTTTGPSKQCQKSPPENGEAGTVPEYGGMGTGTAAGTGTGTGGRLQRCGLRKHMDSNWFIKAKGYFALRLNLA